MKWKTREGSIIPIENMTDDHLKNAINYCIKLDNGRRGFYLTSAYTLLDDLNRREKEEFLKKNKPCPFCKSKMWATEFIIEAPIDVGFSLDEIEYRFHCEKCDAQSNKIKGPNLTEILEDNKII